MSELAQLKAKQSQSTKALCNRIAIVFDFDDTLGVDTFDELLRRLDLDTEQFRHQRVQPLIDQGWDKVAARFYCLIQASHQRSSSDRVTQDSLMQIGQTFPIYEGVSEMFDRLHQIAEKLNPKTELEFYCITGGIGEIVRNTPIAKFFANIWGCEFHYNEHGEIEFLKRSISHTEKTRYLLQVAKGSDSPEGDGRAFAYRDVPESELHVPLSQIIYVGDGASDVPCFSLINDDNGIAIGVYKPNIEQKWGQDVEVTQSQRVSNLAPADYHEQSELMQSLTLAVESLCKKISLRQLSVGE
jgi:phosphoglycolate phosphatase-like HAD superfamily hydrolase